MSNKSNRPTDHLTDTQRNSDQPNIYQFRIEGHLDGQRAKRFEGMSISLKENGETLLTGPVVDQAALHGLLRKVHDLGTPLVSVVRLSHALSDVPVEFNQ